MKKLLVAAAVFSVLCGCGVQGLLDEASVKQEVGKLSDALELYTKAIKQDGRSVEAYEGRARTYVELNKFTDAGSDYFSAAGHAESDPFKKSKAGKLYSMSAFYHDKVFGCEIALFAYQKACKLGVQADCSEAERCSKENSESSK